MSSPHLLLNVEPTEEVVEFGLVASLAGDAEFRGGRRQSSLDARHADLILSNLLQSNILKLGRNITVIVERSLNLIDQL